MDEIIQLKRLEIEIKTINHLLMGEKKENVQIKTSETKKEADKAIRDFKTENARATQQTGVGYLANGYYKCLYYVFVPKESEISKT